MTTGLSVSCRLLKVIAVHNELGEGVVWDASREAVWWTDIQASKLYRYQLHTGTLAQWATPERVCCFSLVADKPYLVVAFESGFAFYDPERDYLHWIEKVEQALSGRRLNDGRADPQGRFWSGGIVEAPGVEKAALFCLDRQLKCHRKLEGLSISNSLCWSPDGTVLYHTDTPTGRIDKYDFDPDTAGLSNPRTFVETTAGHSPDGSIIDAGGGLWNAQWGGSQVVRYTPFGEPDFLLDMPVSQPTCVTFGGDDLSLLFVTSARQGLSPEELCGQPEAGNLFIYQTNVQGLPESQFRPE